MESNLKRIGDYIEQTDIRNENLSVNTLLGVSIEKKFIPSIANTVGTDFTKYKVVEKGQFAYGPVTSRNGDKLSIALLKDYDKCIISSSYIPFRITKPNELNAEYLMLIFSNPEFDRYARYNSWGSAREIFSWEELCDTKISIPDIKEQEKIVREYNTITKRIDILNQINDNL
ncbi:MAG: restriction endonuclease subunit S, partial [Clostridia bacterium]|nr:restriction endonuclease subunit S [Clostridia bacterium]